MMRSYDVMGWAAWRLRLYGGEGGIASAGLTCFDVACEAVEEVAAGTGDAEVVPAVGGGGAVELLGCSRRDGERAVGVAVALGEGQRYRLGGGIGQGQLESVLVGVGPCIYLYGTLAGLAGEMAEKIRWGRAEGGRSFVRLQWAANCRRSATLRRRHSGAVRLRDGCDPAPEKLRRRGPGCRSRSRRGFRRCVR